MHHLHLLSLLSVILAAGQKHMSQSHRYGELKNGMRQELKPRQEDGRMIMMIPMGESGEYQMIPIDMREIRKQKKRRERKLRRQHQHRNGHKRPQHRQHHCRNPNSYRYGTKSMGAELNRPEFNRMMKGQEMPPMPMNLQGKRMVLRHKPYCPMSHRYGEKKMHMVNHHKKYKYVEGYEKKPNMRKNLNSGDMTLNNKDLNKDKNFNKDLNKENKEKELNMNVKKMSMNKEEKSLRKLSNGKVYRSPSYRYGRKYNKMQDQQKMSMQSIQMNKHKKRRALPKAKPMDSSLNMTVVELFEDAKGNLAKAETNIQMATRRPAANLEETHIKLTSSEEGLFRIEGNLRILARPGAEAILAGRKPIGRFEIGSAPLPLAKPEDRKMKKNGYGSYKFKASSIPKVQMDKDLERLGMALLLGIAATLVFLALAKFFFSLWVGLDERKRRDDENKLLLGEESSSTIHPISVAFKN